MTIAFPRLKPSLLLEFVIYSKGRPIALQQYDESYEKKKKKKKILCKLYLDKKNITVREDKNLQQSKPFIKQSATLA